VDSGLVRRVGRGARAIGGSADCWVRRWRGLDLLIEAPVPGEAGDSPAGRYATPDGPWRSHAEGATPSDSSNVLSGCPTGVSVARPTPLRILRITWLAVIHAIRCIPGEPHRPQRNTSTWKTRARS
jgi:hypothetical protein